ncbi:sensor histidine kinase KdpD [Marinifilum sp. N1E240]|uniref:sensor histidine kinase n=1 Tax=Marinifilum sp. N1E240 TaxID=2608082 RepID=UPI00186B9D08|nr:HAMP domain-containing sensor histidine kinase [Marinifilum sp. N1E240]
MKDKKAKEKILEEERIRFIATIAHEIRTPLIGIINFSGLLNKPNISVEKVKSYSKYINTCASKLMTLLNNLIDISKFNSNKDKISRDTLDLNLFLKESTSHFTMQSDILGVQFKISYGLDNKSAQIYTDALKLNVILNNLIGNAVKFTKKGFVDVGYIKKNDCLEFYIKDTGVGISENDQKTIFTPFYQVKDNNECKVNSSGLGLSITKNLVELLGGKIWVESKLNEGSVFSFTIPYEQFELPVEVLKMIEL